MQGLYKQDSIDLIAENVDLVQHAAENLKKIYKLFILDLYSISISIVGYGRI